jgi:hypothetical protein
VKGLGWLVPPKLQSQQNPANLKPERHTGTQRKPGIVDNLMRNRNNGQQQPHHFRSIVNYPWA